MILLTTALLFGAIGAISEQYWTTQRMCDYFGPKRKLNSTAIDKVYSTTTTAETFCPDVISRAPELGICSNFSAGIILNYDNEFKVFNGSHLIELLSFSETSLTFVGDSLSRQMHTTLMCMLEYEKLSKSTYAQEGIKATESNFLTALPAPYFIRDFHFHSDNVTLLINPGWVDKVINSPYKNRIVIINSGAWWHPINILISESTPVDMDGMVEAYRKHFSRNGPMDRMLHHLTNHNVTVIWRDTTPAGICNANNEAEQTKYPYYNRFYQLNVIARKLFTNRKRRHVLPHIYSSTLPLWYQHFGIKYNDPTIDQLHWCTYVPNTAPWIWNTIMYNFLVKEVLHHNHNHKHDDEDEHD
eukprot:gene10447-21800_t